MSGNRVIDTIVGLAYLGLLLVLTARPAWFDKLTHEAAKRAKQIRGTVSW
jgi:hypothetical protein